jgi:hypothetical protein
MRGGATFEEDGAAIAARGSRGNPLRAHGRMLRIRRDLTAASVEVAPGAPHRQADAAQIHIR